MVLANNDQMAKKLVNCTFVILNILYRLVGGQYLCGGGWGNFFLEAFINARYKLPQQQIKSHTQKQVQQAR